MGVIGHKKVIAKVIETVTWPSNFNLKRIIILKNVILWCSHIYYTNYSDWTLKTQNGEREIGITLLTEIV